MRNVRPIRAHLRTEEDAERFDKVGEEGNSRHSVPQGDALCELARTSALGVAAGAGEDRQQVRPHAADRQQHLLHGGWKRLGICLKAVIDAEIKKYEARLCFFMPQPLRERRQRRNGRRGAGREIEQLKLGSGKVRLQGVQ